MVNISLDLADTVVVEPSRKLELKMINHTGQDRLNLSSDSKNIAWKAAEAACLARKIRPEFKITIEKRIPLSAGLAGGSSDGAAVLRLLGEGRSDLASIGIKLGADVPYCLLGKPARVRGIGEIVEPIPMAADLHLVLMNPGFEVSTREIFTRLARDGRAFREHSSDRLVKALASNDLDAIAGSVRNDLQPVTASLYREIEKYIDLLRTTGAVAAFQSGSGPTCIGIYRSEDEALNATEKLQGSARFIFPCRGMAA